MAHLSHVFGYLGLPAAMSPVLINSKVKRRLVIASTVRVLLAKSQEVTCNFRGAKRHQDLDNPDSGPARM